MSRYSGLLDFPMNRGDVIILGGLPSERYLHRLNHQLTVALDPATDTQALAWKEKILGQREAAAFDWGRVVYRPWAPANYDDEGGSAIITGAMTAGSRLSFRERQELLTHAMHEMVNRAPHTGIRAETFFIPMTQPSAIQLFQGVCGAEFAADRIRGVLQFRRKDGAACFAKPPAPAAIEIHMPHPRRPLTGRGHDRRGPGAFPAVLPAAIPAVSADAPSP